MAAKSDRKKDSKTEQQRDAGLARMLNTPPKPHKDMKKGKGDAQKGKRSSPDQG